MEANSKNKIAFYAPAISWGILIVYFTLLPGPKVPDLLKGMKDFFLHFNIYFLFAILLFLGRTQFKLRAVPIKFMLISTILTVVWSGVIEIIQENYIENRTGEFHDFISNISGVVVAVILWKVLIKK